MRISFLSHEYPPLGGGASTALQQMVTHLSQKGHSIQVVTIGTGWKTRRETQANGVELVRLGVGRKRILSPNGLELLASWYGLQFMAGKYIRQFNPSSLCAFFAFPAGFAARSIASQLKIPLAVSLRGSDVPGFSKDRVGIFGKVLPFFFKSAIRSATVVIPNGMHLAELATSYTKDVDVRILPNGVDGNVFCPSDEQKTISPLRILFVGQFIPRKRCLELVEALALLPENGPPIEVTMVGTGPMESTLQKVAAKAPARVKIRFMGFVQRGQLLGVYRKHHLLVQVSQSEGVSNVVLEGLASGLAILASPEAVDGCLNHVKGIEFLQTVNSETLKNAIEELTNDSTRIKRLCSQARISSKQLAWDVRICELEHIFDSIAK